MLYVVAVAVGAAKLGNVVVPGVQDDVLGQPAVGDGVEILPENIIPDDRPHTRLADDIHELAFVLAPEAYTVLVNALLAGRAPRSVPHLVAAQMEVRVALVVGEYLAEKNLDELDRLVVAGAYLRVYLRRVAQVGELLVQEAELHVPEILHQWYYLQPRAAGGVEEQPKLIRSERVGIAHEGVGLIGELVLVLDEDGVNAVAGQTPQPIQHVRLVRHVILEV